MAQVNKQARISNNNNKTEREMKVITAIQELDNAINELREEAKNKGFSLFEFYLEGEQLIKEAIQKYNLKSVYNWQEPKYQWQEADIDVQGLRLETFSAKFEYIAVIKGQKNNVDNSLAIESIHKVVKYKDYLLKPLKNYSEKTYHFTFLQDPIKITVRTKKPNKVSVLTDKKADAWVSALFEDIKQSAIAAKAADARKREFMTKMSKLTNLPEETFAKSGRVDAGIVYIKWQFDENGKAYTSIDWRLSTDEVLKKLSENGLLGNK